MTKEDLNSIAPRALANAVRACSIALVAASISLPSHALDLPGAYQAALQHDSVLAAAEATHRGGIEVLNQAHAQLGTSIQFTASGGLVRERPLEGLPETTSSSTQAGLTVSKPIYHAADSIAEKQAQAQVTRLDVQLNAARQDTFVRVAQAYFNALLAQDNLTFTRLERDAIGGQLAQAKRAFEVGTVPVTDVSDAQTRFDLSSAQEIQNQGDYEVALRGLEILTGVVGQSLAPMRADLRPSVPQPDGVQYWITAAEEHSAGVAQAIAAVDIQQQQIERDRAANSPAVDVVGGISDQRYGNANLTRNNSSGLVTSIGLQLTVPLWDGGARNSKVRQSVAGADQAREELTTARRTAAQSARQAYISVTSSIAQTRALERATTSAEQSLEASVRGREAGYRTSIDVLNARQLLFQARRQMVTSRYSSIVSLIQLKSIVGALTEGDLQGLTAPSP